MGRKDFNKGMEAGARPFEEKFRQEQKRNQEWKQTFEEKFDGMKETNEAILNEMESKEKEKFYKNHTIVDIKELGKGDRETLLSILFTLSEMEEEVTEYQQQFIRSIKRYLENTEGGERPENWSVLKDNDWSVIETIYGVDETKAIVQAVMIFLFLGYENHEAYMDEYEDVFECFNLNKKGFGEIREQIDVLWRVTGFQGLAEMYGYVPEVEVQEGQEQNISGERENSKNLYGTHGELDELRITENIELFSDREELIFENKRLIVVAKIGTGLSGIAAKGTKQIFNNCEILIDGEMKEDSAIIKVNEGTVIFENCIIRSGKQLLIDALGNTNLEIKNSYLDCGGRIFEERHGEASVSVRHSLIECRAEDCQNRLFAAGEIEVFDTVFHGEQSNASPDYSSKLSGSVFEAHKVLHIDECKFYNFMELPFMINAEICNSVFEKCCVKITSGTYNAPYEYKEKGGLFKNCEFEDCIFTQSAPDCRMRFENINLKSCVGVMPAKYMKNVTSEGGFLVVRMEEKIELSGCRFSDWSYEQYKDILDKEGHNPFWYTAHWTLLSEDDRTAIAAGYGSKITNCQFENLKLGKLSLIGGFPYATSSYTLQNCQFENIQVGKNGILKKEFRHEKGGMFRTKTVIKETIMKVENCVGL